MTKQLVISTESNSRSNNNTVNNNDNASSNRNTSRKVSMSQGFMCLLNSEEKNGQKDGRKIVFCGRNAEFRSSTQ